MHTNVDTEKIYLTFYLRTFELSTKSIAFRQMSAYVKIKNLMQFSDVHYAQKTVFIKTVFPSISLISKQLKAFFYPLETKSSS